MKNKNTIEEDLNKIRLKIYEETKHMTPQEHTEYYKKKAERMAKQYGFKFVKTAN